MWYRVVKPFSWPDQRGQKKAHEVGTLVDILNRHDAAKLLSSGLITEREFSWERAEIGQPAKPYAYTKRIGIWLTTSAGYSGGRIHMYQYAWTLAKQGAEVFLITNRNPVWRKDYPKEKNLTVLIEGSNPIPPDLDLVVTDSKQDLGKKALKFKKRFPKIPFVCFNFETPNWVAKYEKKYAGRLANDKAVFQGADFYIANSNISMQHLLEWVGKDTPGEVLNPAVNTFALEEDAKVRVNKRPFAVFSSRPTGYKNGDLVVKTIWGLDVPFDLVVFGKLPHAPANTDKHKLVAMEGHSDATKFGCMKAAHIVLAPSKFEGFGMVPGEALASGTNCVVYDLPVLREAYGDDLIYVPWDDGKAFTQKVREIATKPKAAVPDAVVKRIQITHGMEGMADKLEKMPFHSMKRKSVSCHMICYWGFVPESLESVYPYVDEIRIAYGPTKLNKSVPPDGSLELIKAFPDPDNKITLEVRKEWADKQQMREFCTDKMSGNYHLVLDADEIWIGLDKWVEAGYPFTSPRWVNLWHGAEYWVYDNAKMAGLRWGKKIKSGGSVCPHYRWSWWRSSFRWKKHHTVVDSQDNRLHRPNNGMIAKEMPDCLIYHVGHALSPAVMKAKHEFYRNRDGDTPGRKKRQSAWHKWNGKEGDCGDGIIARVDWDIPEIVTRAIERLKDEASQTIRTA